MINKNRKWNCSEVAMATGRTYDQVSSWMTNQGRKSREGMTFDDVLNFLETKTRNRKPKIDQKNIDDLVNALKVFGYEKEVGM